MIINPFKQALRQQKTLYGIWHGLPSTVCAELVASAGFDWILIDGEHGPFDVTGIMSHLQTIAAYDSPAIVRAVNHDAALLKRLLDIGAQSLLIPMVETQQQAEAIAQSVRYPPQGIRGMGTSTARAARWNQIPDYIAHANNEICTIAQIETPLALENLASIAQVDGIDALFIGPTDLSATLGYVGQPTHPEVVKQIEWAIDTINSLGKPVGILAVQLEMATHYANKGVKFIGVGVDAPLLANALKQLASTYIQSINSNNLAGY